MKLHWWDVFGFWDLELDQSLRGGGGHSIWRLLVSDHLHIFWSVSCVEGLPGLAAIVQVVRQTTR